jgi:hypothetical protein
VQRIIWSAVLMVFGVLMVVGAGFGMTDSVVKCGGEVMQPGDICEGKTRSGQVTQKTFEETRVDSKAGTIMGVVIGVVIIGLGGLSLRVGIRNHRRGPAQPVGQPPVWGPGHQRGQETAQPQWGPSPGQPQQQWNQASPQQPRWGAEPRSTASAAVESSAATAGAAAVGTAAAARAAASAAGSGKLTTQSSLGRRGAVGRPHSACER